MRHIYLLWSALLTALAFALPTHAQLASSDATDVTQTRATLHAEFPSDASSRGFEYKYGKLTALTDFDRLALSPFSDPINLTTTGNKWSARTVKGWVESCKDLTSGQYSEMTTTFTLTAHTTITFEWSVDSEENYGILSFSVDGTKVAQISGNVPFTTVTRLLSAGEHTLKWRYDKKSSTNVGLDLGMVKNIHIANTTPGEWISAEATADDHTVTNLYPSQSYLWRAYSTAADSGTHSYSPLRQFTTKDVSVDSVHVTDITQTKARLTSQVNPGDAQVTKGFEFAVINNTDPYALALLASNCTMPITLTHDSAWGIGNDKKSLHNSTRRDGNTVTVSFYMAVDGYVSFDYSVYGGRISVLYDNTAYTLSSYSDTVKRAFSKGKHTIAWKSYYSYGYSTYSASLSNLKFTDSQDYVISSSESLKPIIVDSEDNLMSGLEEGLKPGHTYSVRSYIKPDFESPLASAWSGTYSPWTSFSTLCLIADTISASNIMQASAIINGKVKGGDANIIACGSQYRDKEGKRFTDFPSTSSDTLLSQKLTRLRPSTDYEYRAYIQAEDCDTVFSPLAKFRTADVVPVKPELLAVTQHTAKIQGKVISGDATIYQRGMQFCKNGAGWEDVEDGGTDSIYVLSKTNLLINQKYKARTYVQPAGSTIIYSDVLEFTTNGLCDTITDIFQRTAIVRGHIESGLSDISKSYYTIDARYEPGHIIDEPSNLKGSFNILMGSWEQRQAQFFDYKIRGDKWSTDGYYLNTPNEDGEHELSVELNLPHDCVVTFEYNGWGENGSIFPLSWTIDNDLTIPHTEMRHYAKKILQKGSHRLLLRVKTGFKMQVPVRLQVGEIPVDFPISSDGSFAFKATPLTPHSYNGITITTEDKEGKPSNTKVNFSTKDYFKFPFSVTDVSQSGAVLSAQLEKTDDRYEETGFAYYAPSTSYSNEYEKWSKIKGEINDTIVVAALKNLQPSHFYYFVPYTKVDGKYYYCTAYDPMSFTVNGIDISVNFSGITQTKASMTTSVNKGDAQVTNFRYSLDGGEYKPYTKEVKFTGLRPGTKHTVDFAAEVNGETKYWSYNPKTEKRYSFTTLSTSVNMTLGEVAQTLIGASWTTTYGDATYVASGIEYGTSQSALTEQVTSDSNSVRINELTPATTYYFRAYLETKEGGRVYSATRNAMTKSISCTTGKATDVSNNSAKFHGTIDCDSYSPTYRFGFQWKQMQGWAAEPAFTRANKLDDGTITLGLVDRMLKPDTDYQFRTAVMRGDEVVAHGADWQTFRTELEYIYYPGTVYTLYRTDRETNSLILCGYYVAGSEPVIEQGYDYWTTSKSAPIRIPTDETMRHTLDISTLDDGNYQVRAFATTASGTVYGETLGFSIFNGGLSATADIAADSDIRCYGTDEGIVIDNATGYTAIIMDVTGRQLSHRENMGIKESFPMAQDAIYIVKISDGSVFKVKL